MSDVGKLRYGPARVPSRESPEKAVELLRERGYTACEIDFEGGFWMDYPWAEEFGKLARRRRIALSRARADRRLHGPRRARQEARDGGRDARPLGRDREVAAGAEPVVFHPGFLLERTRKRALAQIVEQLADLRTRLEGKGRGVPFGVEIMGRVREIGSLDDVVHIASRLPWVRPVIDFAHLHAVTDGAFTTTKAFHDVLSAANKVLPRGAPFHIHFSDIAYANRNETKHLPYGEGTLRAEPLGKALARFARPATVITESPGRGVESGDSGRALRGGREELAAPLFAALGLVFAAALAQERRIAVSSTSYSTSREIGAGDARRSPPAKSSSASSSRPCAARTMASEAAVVAREVTSQRTDGLAGVEGETLGLLDSARAPAAAPPVRVGSHRASPGRRAASTGGSTPGTASRPSRCRRSPGAHAPILSARATAQTAPASENSRSASSAASSACSRCPWRR